MIPDDPIDDLHAFETPDEAFQYIRYAGTLPDADIDLAETALAQALLFLPGVKPDRFRQHLRKMAEQVIEEYQQQLRQQRPDRLATRIEVLKKIIHAVNDYHGDREQYDDIQNANLIRVIDRRRGLPVALGLLYIILARRAGWQAEGLNFPGHFLVRVEDEGERVILDPFQDGAEMDAAGLRQLLKSIVGEKAELSHQFYVPVGNRDMLIRLQNNLKKRLIDQEEYAQAVIVVEAMEALAPDEYRTLFDKAMLYAKLGQRQQAIRAFEDYIEKTPDAREKQQARGLLEQIKMLPE